MSPFDHVRERQLMELFYRETGKGAIQHWYEYVAWRKAHLEKATDD